MRTLLLLVALSVSAVSAADYRLVRQCISQGGSIYDIDIDMAQHLGEVRYRWMGQDIFYQLQSITEDGEVIMAVAKFYESRSGETKGRPWVFSYHMGRDTVIDSGREHLCK